MINNQRYLEMKRDYRRTGDIVSLLPLLEGLVGRVTGVGKMPPWLSATGSWDEEGRRDALQGWLEKRLLRRRDILAAFDYAAAPGPFMKALEKSFRHYLINAAPRTELENLLARAVELLRSEPDVFSEGSTGTREYWGLAEWRSEDSDLPFFGGSDRDLLALAWSQGDFEIVRYSARVGRASPILSTPDLKRFLEGLLASCEGALDRTQLRIVFRDRFDLAQEDAMPLEEASVAQAAGEPEAALEEADARAIALLVLEEMTPQRAQVLVRKHDGATLEEIAEALQISRGTADNELRRVGSLINRLRGDYSERKILEILLDALS